MKRQRSINTETEIATAPTLLQKNEECKKVKRAVEEAKEKDIGGGVAVESLCGLEDWDWGCLSGDGGATDELMSWGCFWSPFWGVDYVDLGHAEFFSDVAWDGYDDIWNLKTVVEIPKP